MPTAKFQADFSDFLNKTREASGSLEKLADAAGSTSGSLSKIGSSFSGEAVIRKAVDTVQAIEKIGGASALTEKEMVKVNASVTEAIAKLGALGAKAIGDPSVWGLDAAVPAAFLALVWPRLKSKDDYVLAIGAAALAITLTPIIAAGLPIIATALLAVAFARFKP